MLTPYRRHKRTCPHVAEGRNHRHCKCAIWVDGILDGKEIRLALKLRDWTKANQVVQEMESGQDSKTSDAVTIEKAWLSIHSDFIAKALSNETIRKYKHLENQMKAFAAEGGLKLLRQFDLDAVTRFRATWTDAPLSASKKLERLRAFFAFALKRRWVESNPAKEIKLPKIRHSVTLPLDAGEITRFFKACDDLAAEANSGASRLKALRLKPLAIVMRYTGLRISDAVQLSKSEVAANAITVSQAKTGVTVRVPVPPIVTMELAKTPMITATRYFWTGNGARESAVKDYQEMMKEAFDRAGIAKGTSNAMSHRFRDTFAVELLKAATPIARVSKLLGHSSIAITERHYSPWDKAQQLQAEADVIKSWENDVLLHPVVAEKAKVARPN